MRMLIPTQEERYSKRTLMTLILCVMAPAGVYAYFISSKFNIPVDSIAGMLNLMLFFTYPLALVFQGMGVPKLAWGGLSWGGIGCSLIVHALFVAWLYRGKKLTPKMSLTLAVIAGFLDLLLCKMINAGYV